MSILKSISDALKGKAPLGSTRSPQWSKVRAEHLKKNPTCAVCSGVSKIEVHHIVPFHIDPSKELEPTNLITLCESNQNGINCHLAFGHLGNYQSVNKTVKTDARVWNKKLRTRKVLSEKASKG
jgi:5-methylcytosine-specific restriction enzyme A